MLFNSVEYILCFLPLTFITYFTLNKYKLYNTSLLFLLISSLYFYSTYNIKFTYIIILSTLLNYSINLLLNNKNLSKLKKPILILGITLNILILLFFKYFNILIQSLKTNLHLPINSLEIIIPLGISFFTIQQISFLIDSYNNKISKPNLINYSLFISFFPQLLAGPIVRYKEIIPQLNNAKNKIINQQNIFKALFLITIGLLKKVLIADNFQDFITYTTTNSLYYDTTLSWLFAFSKVAQGYFDFSGYCDIATGSALLFNIKLPQNFNSPFKATNITNYWKRWHMTLIRFLKDYILTPLGGIKTTTTKTFTNLMIVGFCYGCWKAINPVYILYGLLNALFIFFDTLIAKTRFKLNKYLANFLTFIVILLTTPLIAQKNLSDSFSLYKTMLNLGNFNLSFKITNFSFDFSSYFNCADFKLNIFLFLACIYLMFFSKNSFELSKIYVKKNNIFYTVILAIIMTICTLSITRYREFIYFNFN